MKLATFSIVARDAKTGLLGVAGGTNWFCYGRWVPHIEAGVGALATQAETNMWYAPNGLEELELTHNAAESLNHLLGLNPDKDGIYQLLIMDKSGHTACHTGNSCPDYAGHILESNFGVAGNTLVSADTLQAVADTYKKAVESPLGLRMIKALQAGQEAGGDIRGMKSAAIKIASGKSSGRYWDDILYDLRVDDHSNPLKELERLYLVAEAYDYLNEAESTQDSSKAIDCYRKALEKDPNNAEAIFWLARRLHGAGQKEESQRLRQQLLSYPGKWDEFWRRLDD